MLISVTKSSNNSASVSLYVLKTFDVTNHEKEYHEKCLLLLNERKEKFILTHKFIIVSMYLDIEVLNIYIKIGILKIL